MDLTDEQWAVIEPHIPKPRRHTDGKGRPLKPAREVLDGILWILRTGAAWQNMPDRYPAYQTCHRRFQSWVRSRKLRRYRNRWKIECLFAWLENYRRILHRHDYYPENFLGFLHLGCLFIYLKNYF